MPHTPSPNTWGLVGVGMTLGTAAAAGLEAPTVIWVVMAVAALGCFAAAYRQYRSTAIGTDQADASAPVGPPSSFPPGYIQFPPEPQRVIHSWEQPSSDALKIALKRERGKGQGLLSGLSIAARTSILTPRVSRADVDAWEATVRYLLRGQPDALTIFDHDPPEPLMRRAMLNTSIALSGGQLGERLRRRLGQLDKVIVGL